MKKNLGIFIFDDVEILDFTGPYEVFSATRLSKKVLSKKNIKEIYKTESPFNIFTISENKKDITTRGGLKVSCDYIFFDDPMVDILLLPGGLGTRKLINNKNVISWIKKKKDIELMFSVCTGSLLLAAAGLLRNQKAATHWSAEGLLKRISPSTQITRKRYVMDHFYSSAGVASGIDLSLRIVEKYFGKRVADNTSKYIEYKITKE